MDRKDALQILGAKVRDRITGFEGVATSATHWLNGCVRIGVQPPVDKDGKHQDALTFDIEQLDDLTPKPPSMAERMASDSEKRGEPGVFTPAFIRGLVQVWVACARSCDRCGRREAIAVYGDMPSNEQLKALEHELTCKEARISYVLHLDIGGEANVMPRWCSGYK